MRMSLWMALVIFTMLGCKRETGVQEFPILHVEVTDVNEKGATFFGEVVYLGTHETSEYGFVYSPRNAKPTIDDFVISKGVNLNTEMYRHRLDENLSDGFVYWVRAYSISKGRVIYSNTVHFTSEGCEADPHSKVFQGLESSVRPEYGFTSSSQAFIHFVNGDVEHVQLEKGSSTSMGWLNAKTGFRPFYNNDQLYYLKNDYIYRFNGNTGVKVDPVPYDISNIYEMHYGFSYNNEAVVIGRDISLTYNFATDTWSQKTALNHNYKIMAACHKDSEAFVLTEFNKILKYSVKTDQWEFVTDFPGEVKKKVFAFAYGNKVIFGFGHDEKDETEDWFTETFWTYNLNSKTWQESVPFPISLENGRLLAFQLNDKLYLGHTTMHYVNLFSMDLYAYDLGI